MRINVHLPKDGTQIGSEDLVSQSNMIMETGILQIQDNFGFREFKKPHWTFYSIYKIGIVIKQKNVISDNLLFMMSTQDHSATKHC